MAFSPAKRMILAIGAAGIAATGAIAGAQYKSEREKEMAKAIVARDLQVRFGVLDSSQAIRAPARSPGEPRSIKSSR